MPTRKAAAAAVVAGDKPRKSQRVKKPKYEQTLVPSKFRQPNVSSHAPGPVKGSKDRKSKKPSTKFTTPNKRKPVDSSSLSESDDADVCCVLCHAAVDYSDRAAFFQQDRDLQQHEEPDTLLPNQLLPTSLYDAHNTIVFCDTCDKPYHQRCHFVPIIALPRGDWHCLLCKYAAKHTAATTNTTTTTTTTTEVTVATTSLYTSPPSSTVEQERLWEYSARSMKIQEFTSEMKRLKSAISQQLQHVRLAQTTMLAYTSTRKARTHLNLKSQELCQTLCKLAGAKLRVRQLLLSLEAYLKGRDDHVQFPTLLQFVKNHPEETKFWFPFGQHERRLVPKFDTPKGEGASGGIPSEVTTVSLDQYADESASATQKEDQKAITEGNKSKDDDDNDDMISLDDLKCCICFKGDATDENDVLMCDGEGCFRAHHMHCLPTPLTQQEAEAEDDWFCPLCTAMAKLIASVQSEYTGDEWEADDATVESWDQVADVFPESEHEYTMAIKWKEGKVDIETSSFLASYFGVAFESISTVIPSPRTAAVALDADDEEDEDDDDFDLADFESSRNQSDGANENDADNDDDDSAGGGGIDHSLSDMSSVELNIPKGELDALSACSTNDDDEDVGDQKPRRRTRSGRSSRANTSGESSADDVSKRPDVGTLDESNIIQGKRRRQKVDYRRLNDAMFGALTENEIGEIDDKDDFTVKIVDRKDSSSSEDDDESDDGDGGDACDGDEAAVEVDDAGSNDEDEDECREAEAVTTSTMAPPRNGQSRRVASVNAKSTSVASSRKKKNGYKQPKNGHKEASTGTSTVTNGCSDGGAGSNMSEPISSTKKNGGKAPSGTANARKRVPKRNTPTSESAESNRSNKRRKKA